MSDVIKQELLKYNFSNIALLLNYTNSNSIDELIDNILKTRIVNNMPSNKILEKYKNDVNNLSESIRDAIYTYVLHSHSKYGNDFVEGKVNIMPLDTQVYEKIQRALISMEPIREEVVVYRGQNLDYLDTDSWFSTSINKNISIEFTENNCCLFVIHLQPRIKVLPVYYIDSIKEYKFEEEVIVQGGGYLEEINQEIVNGLKIIHCKYSLEPPKVVPKLKIEKKLQKNLTELSKFVHKDEIAEMLELFEEEPTEENIKEQIKSVLNSAVKQFKDKFPFLIDDTDVDEIYKMIYK
jgi:hypothetical protein